jgi:hypothetical protein
MALTGLVSLLDGVVASVASRRSSARSGASTRGPRATGLAGDQPPAEPSRRPDPIGSAPVPDVGRLLAIDWLRALKDRPFRPSPQELDWVAGEDLVDGEARSRRVRVAASRFAGLFADHVAQDMSIEGGPGAYAWVWQSARQAFVEVVAADGDLVMRTTAGHDPVKDVHRDIQPTRRAAS